MRFILVNTGLFAAFVVFKLWGCPQPLSTTEQLQAAGYSEIEVQAWRGHRCLDYWHATGFTARAPSGQRVTGAVCCGILKACTTNVSAVRK